MLSHEYLKGGGNECEWARLYEPVWSENDFFSSLQSTTKDAEFHQHLILRPLNRLSISRTDQLYFYILCPQIHNPEHSLPLILNSMFGPSITIIAARLCDLFCVLYMQIFIQIYKGEFFHPFSSSSSSFSEYSISNIFILKNVSPDYIHVDFKWWSIHLVLHDSCEYIWKGVVQ